MRIQVLERKLDPEKFDEVDVFINAHKKKRGLGEFTNQATKEFCEKVNKRNEELKSRLQGSEKVKLSAVLNDVAGRHHDGCERGYGAGFSRRITDQYSAIYNIAYSESNTHLQEELKFAHEQIMELRLKAEEAELEKIREREERAREREERAREMEELKNLFAMLSQQ